MRPSKASQERIRARVLRDQRKARRRSLRAAEAIARGEIKVPLRCGHCQSQSVVKNFELPALNEIVTDEELRCLQCDRKTLISAAHTARKQEIAMIIQAGFDPRTRG